MSLTFCIREITKWVLLQAVKTQMHGFSLAKFGANIDPLPIENEQELAKMMSPFW